MSFDAVSSPADLPRSIEDGERPPGDLGGYDRPLVVVIPFVPATAAYLLGLGVVW